ncbi:MAG TPA: DUF4148 domain-containing protein [Ramlibacter sp.]|nr:DUF4148 domain-containing protein [Ramlibacter sp.]
MNRNFALIAVFAAAATTSAFADDITIDPTPFVSTRARAEVQAELAQYKQEGVNPWSISYNPLKYFHSEKSREQVQQEFVASRDAVKAMTGEDSGSAYLAAHRGQETGTSLASR